MIVAAIKRRTLRLFLFKELMFCTINLLAHLWAPWQQMMTSSNNYHHQPCGNQATRSNKKNQKKNTCMKPEWLASPWNGIKSWTSGGQTVKCHSAKQTTEPPEINMVENGTNGGKKGERESRVHLGNQVCLGTLRMRRADVCVCEWMDKCVSGVGSNWNYKTCCPSIHPSVCLSIHHL